MFVASSASALHAHWMKLNNSPCLLFRHSTTCFLSMVIFAQIYALKWARPFMTFLKNSFHSSYYFHSTSSVSTFWTVGQGLVLMTPSVTLLDSEQLTELTTHTQCKLHIVTSTVTTIAVKLGMFFSQSYIQCVLYCQKRWVSDQYFCKFITNRCAFGICH